MAQGGGSLGSPQSLRDQMEAAVSISNVTNHCTTGGKSVEGLTPAIKDSGTRVTLVSSAPSLPVTTTREVMAEKYNPTCA